MPAGQMDLAAKRRRLIAHAFRSTKRGAQEIDVMEVRLMKPVGIISTGVLLLLLGSVAPTYAQQDHNGGKTHSSCTLGLHSSGNVCGTISRERCGSSIVTTHADEKWRPGSES